LWPVVWSLVPVGAGYAELDRCGRGSEFVELGELAARGGEADSQALDFTEPSLAAGFGDTVDEVVADLGEAATLGRVASKPSGTLAFASHRPVSSSISKVVVISAQSSPMNGSTRSNSFKLAGQGTQHPAIPAT